MQALSSRLRAGVVLAFFVAVVCCVAWAPVVFAQSGSESSEASSSKSSESSDSTDSSDSSESASASGGEGSADSKAMLILDASSSMLEDDADGPRIDAAKKASKDLIESLPGTAQLGLMVYGAQESDAPDNREAGCKDIETLEKVGQVDKEKYVKAIEGVTPKGYTPMGNSLREAAKELGDEGERSIILVSDGIDSCAPPPVCEVAKELAEEGVDLAIHTVGFKVDEEARKELQCIADAGKGQFLEADDAGSLADSLKFLTQRDVGKYQLKGTKFEFADSPEDAKWLDEGQYQTKVTPDRNAKKDRYFRVSVPEEHNARITITPVVQGNGEHKDSQLFITTSDIVNENDESCGSTNTTLASASNFITPGYGIDSYHIVLDRAEQHHLKGKENRCDMSSWLIPVQVYQNGDEITDDVNLEIAVHYVPIPDEEQAKEWKDRKISSPGEPDEVPEIEDPEAITGGSGFNDAVEITEGSYSDKIVPGEFRMYKIPVKWGQRPVIKAKTPKSVVKEADSMGFGIYNPYRKGLAGGKLIFFDEDVEEGPVAPTDFAWHREVQQGFFYVWFGMGTKGAGKVTGVEQPYEFAVALDGEPADGGPDWEPTYEDGPEPSNEPIKFDSAKNDDSKKDGENNEDGAGAADNDESGRPSWLLPLVIGSGLLLLLLIGLLVFLLRRKNKGATSRVDARDGVRRDPRDGSTVQFGQAEQYRQPSQPGQYGPGTPNRPENPYGPGTSNGPGTSPYA
ncbi:VWA domain-containing protein [Corynebacterium sp. p3-SID1194]|uniref:vWA domain-containing protein n=1 Tax=Corynebacterium sp. p3-SID1194 TaxID=2916105 RepID=UPI0021A29F46|nr:VWA domain-containing protein [Corynebacterium sp. p3-SID1194]MCT1451169.1 VWA domain-containing protein [Corynebacterium sp. p3-SID1194]